LQLFHLDLYRLTSLEQIIATGLEEYLRPEGVTVIEWADKIQSLRSGMRWVNIEVVSQTERRICYEDISA
jgi:tRNA threonylcarbamoyladenosine biosynthesis protein TsaE